MNFRSLLSLLLVGLVGAPSLSAQSLPNALLWKVTGPGISEPSYVMGTIHMIGSDDYFFSPEMEQAFDNTKRLALEIDLNEMQNMGAMFSLMNKMFMANGQKLKDLVTAEEYEVVKSKFSQMGLPMMFLDRVKPMFLQSMVGGPGGGQGGLQSGAVKSYEMELNQKAQDQEKKVLGLETIEFQMSIFDSIPYKTQAKMLVESLKSDSLIGGDDFAEMAKLYKNEEIEKLAALINADTTGIGNYATILLVNRNKAWIPRMKELMKEQPTFFAVGAGHLAGEHGVIPLLKKAGYTLTPIPSSKGIIDQSPKDSTKPKVKGTKRL